MNHAEMRLPCPLGASPYHGQGIRYTPGLTAAVQVEVYRNLRTDLGGLAIKHVGFVLPLLDRIDSSTREHRGTADNTEVFNVARLGDRGIQNDRAAQTG